MKEPGILASVIGTYKYICILGLASKSCAQFIQCQLQNGTLLKGVESNTYWNQFGEIPKIAPPPPSGLCWTADHIIHQIHFQIWSLMNLVFLSYARDFYFILQLYKSCTVYALHLLIKGTVAEDLFKVVFSSK